MVRFKKAALIDINLYYEWANDELVRKQSFNSEPINFEDHKKWFTSKIKDTSCMMLVFKNLNDENIGQIRIQQQEFNNSLIGISIDQNHRGKGFAGVMLEIASVEWFSKNPFDTINAYIKIENTSSKYSFEKAGFNFKENILYENYLSFHYIKNKHDNR